MEKVIKGLKEQVYNMGDCTPDEMREKSWGYEAGVLISGHDATKIIGMYEKAKARIDEFRADYRLGYPAALIQINAPLALIQVDLLARLNELERLMGMEQTKLPKGRADF